MGYALGRVLVRLLVAATEVGDKDDLYKHLFLDEAEAHGQDGHADEHVEARSQQLHIQQCHFTFNFRANNCAFISTQWRQLDIVFCSVLFA